MTTSTRGLLALLLALTTSPIAVSDEGESSAPTYQRRPRGYFHGYEHFDSHRGAEAAHSYYRRRPHYDARRFAHHPQRTQSFQFQRPYPYHLDYYKMRYGGSYAPYFGNLYGPPQVFAPSHVQAGYADPGYSQPHGYPMAYPSSSGEAILPAPGSIVSPPTAPNGGEAASAAPSADREAAD